MLEILLQFLRERYTDVRVYKGSPDIIIVRVDGKAYHIAISDMGKLLGS